MGFLNKGPGGIFGGTILSCRNIPVTVVFGSSWAYLLWQPETALDLIFPSAP